MSIEVTKIIYLFKLVEVLRERGCDSESVLEAAGLREITLPDHDASMPLGQYLAGVEAAVRENAAPDLGFLVGEKTTPLDAST